MEQERQARSNLRRYGYGQFALAIIAGLLSYGNIRAQEYLGLNGQVGWEILCTALFLITTAYAVLVFVSGVMAICYGLGLGRPPTD